MHCPALHFDVQYSKKFFFRFFFCFHHILHFCENYWLLINRTSENSFLNTFCIQILRLKFFISIWKIEKKIEKYLHRHNTIIHILSMISSIIEFQKYWKTTFIVNLFYFFSIEEDIRYKKKTINFSWKKNIFSIKNKLTTEKLIITRCSPAPSEIQGETGQ